MSQSFLYVAVARRQSLQLKVLVNSLILDIVSGHPAVGMGWD